MKKKIKLLLIPLLLIIPNIVNASLMCGQLRIVTNPNGVDIDCNIDLCEGEGKHLKENEVFYTITTHGNDNTENCKDCLITTVEGNYYTIKNLEGTRIPQEDDLNEAFFNKYYSKIDNAEGIIYNENGTVDIRKGPGENYDIIGHIDTGTKINYTYMANENCINYVYVNYNNINGWIKFDKEVLTKENHKYIATKDVNIGCTTIPKNTIINTSYITHVIDENYGVLVEYGNCKKAILDINDSFSHEFLNIDTTDPEIDNKITAKEDITIYEYYNNEGKELITIPKGQEYIYYAGHWITDTNSIVTDTIEYVSYNGIKGWIKIPEKNNNSQTSAQNTEEIKKEPNYITYYIIACSVIILITIIVIVLINKKKITKKED